ncbi:MAG: permease-like cell division protein FtsX [Ezakiella massiliensis]|uniref:permease-like cell division protein FtsX n=1 Tax=Ezakiella peruensis TaxID=1464038 RepID=UPI000C1B1934|nr:permease-like cell division protein FtsX [Ezakiella peruensis]
MKFRVFANMIKQGFQGLNRNKSMGMISIVSIAIVLVILGLMLIMVLSINQLVMDTNKKMDQIDIFIDDNLDVPQIEAMADQIAAIGGIKKIRFKSPAEGLKELKSSWGENAWLLDEYEDEEKNPIPKSFEIRVNNIEDAEAVAKKLGKMDGVWKVNYFAKEIEQMLAISKYIQIGGIFMVGFLSLVSIFLMSNTIRLAVNSRRTEISIMKWVGATDAYIKGPFFVEGVLMGFIGSLIAFLIVAFGYRYFYLEAINNVTGLLSSAIVPPSFFYSDMAVIFATLGIGIAALGSLISLKRFLRV